MCIKYSKVISKVSFILRSLNLNFQCCFCVHPSVCTLFAETTSGIDLSLFVDLWLLCYSLKSQRSLHYVS